MFAFKDGDEHEAIVEVNGVVKERLIDVMTNLGTEDCPAFFPIVKNHTVDGVEVENGTSRSNAFRSVTLLEYLDLVKDFAKVYGYEVSAQSSSTDVEPFRMVFPHLRDYMLKNKVDLGLIVELKKLAKVNAFSLANTTKATYDGVDSYLSSLEMKLITGKITPEQLQKDVVIGTKGPVAEVVIKAVAKVTKYVKYGLKIIVTLIEGTQPKVDLKSNYVAYLNEKDSVSTNYPTSGHVSQTDEYTVKHTFWGVTYAKASFMVMADYMGTHSDMNEYYVPNIAMLVENIKCVTGQHVEGTATYGETDPYFETSTVTPSMNRIVVPGNIHIDYGDCCCYDYHCQLDFTVYGDKGIEINNWKDK